MSKVLDSVLGSIDVVMILGLLWPIGLGVQLLGLRL